jgi:hypothetical protein
MGQNVTQKLIAAHLESGDLDMSGRPSRAVDGGGDPGPYTGRRVDELTRAWTDAAARLPGGWALDSLRCASASLRPEDRSTDWVAVAVDAAGAVREYRAADPTAALSGLVDSLR